MTLEIEKVTAVQSKYSMDYIVLHTQLPSPFPKVSDQKLRLTFNVEQGKGPEYVLEHFGIEAEVVQQEG